MSNLKIFICIGIIAFLIISNCSTEKITDTPNTPNNTPNNQDTSKKVIQLPDSIWIDSATFSNITAAWDSVSGVDSFQVILFDGSGKSLDTVITNKYKCQFTVSPGTIHYMVGVKSYAGDKISENIKGYAKISIVKIRNPQRVYLTNSSETSASFNFTPTEDKNLEINYWYRAYLRDYNGIILDSTDIDSSLSNGTITGLTENKAYKISLVTVTDIGPMSIDSNCVYDTSANQRNAKKYPYLYVSTYENPAAPLDTSLVSVKGGIFAMGYVWERDSVQILITNPVHEVIVSSFCIGKYEITVQEYKDFLNAINSNLKIDNYILIGKDTIIDTSLSTWPLTYKDNEFFVKTGKEKHPMLCLTWYGAAAYCNWLSVRNGLAPCYDVNWNCDFTKNGYRLPTEAEFEYVCSGAYSGLKYRFSWGSQWDVSSGAVNCGLSKPVGSFGARLGIYDLTGNAIEYVNDWSDVISESSAYSPYYKECLDKGVVTDPRGPDHQVENYKHLMRGGSYERGISANVVTYRYANPCNTYSDYGFRIAKKID